MATTNFTTRLGLALPTQGDLSGTWGNEVNNFISNYVDFAVAGALTVSGDVSLSRTTAPNPIGSTSTQYATIIASGHTSNITITVASTAAKPYFVINSSGTYTVKICGTGPTTGVTLAVNEKATVAWNGSDFVKIASSVAGTVTSVGWTGGIVSVGTPTTTPAFTIAGTSGGVPYFNSATTWTSSAALAANALVVGGGAGAAPATVTTGIGVLTALSVNTGTAGAFVVNGGALGTPSSGTVTNLTGTASININGTVGATTANTGTFTSTVYNGSASGSITIAAPAVAGTQSYSLPTGLPAVSGYALTSTTAGVMSWAPVSGGSGVSTISIATANGFAGTSSGGSTPALTLTTSVSGIIKGSGSALVSATAGTDYLSPPSGTAILKANAGGALANATAGTDYLAPPSGTAILKANSGGALSNASAGTDYQAPITLTTLNTSGAATFVGNTLNIPQYSGGGGGGVTSFSGGLTGFTPNTATPGAIVLAGSLAVGSGGTGATATTGSGNNVLSTSPTLVTPILGTPQSGALTNCTNIPVANATGSLPVINGGTGATAITGTGNNVLSTSPTITTPVISGNTTVNGLRLGSGAGSGADNIVFGSLAGGGSSSTGGNNITIGSLVGGLLSTGYSNIAVGSLTLQSCSTGSENTAVGYSALNDITTGIRNTGLGSLAGQNITTGGNNVAIGYSSLNNGLTVSDNVAVGAVALFACTTDGNTGVGHFAGNSITSGGVNTCIGYSSGSNLTTGQNNVCIGYSSGTSSASVSNTVTLGNGSIATLRCAVTSITAISDARDKKDIVDIPIGLSFIEKLRPVSFKWAMRNLYEDPKFAGKQDIPEFGFIAQDLQLVQEETGVTVPNLVMDDNPDRIEAAPSALLPILIKAIQELTARVKELEAK